MEHVWSSDIDLKRFLVVFFLHGFGVGQELLNINQKITSQSNTTLSTNFAQFGLKIFEKGWKKLRRHTWTRLVATNDRIELSYLYYYFNRKTILKNKSIGKL